MDVKIFNISDYGLDASDLEFEDTAITEAVQSIEELPSDMLLSYSVMDKLLVFVHKKDIKKIWISITEEMPLQYGFESTVFEDTYAEEIGKRVKSKLGLHSGAKYFTSLMNYLGDLYYETPNPWRLPTIEELSAMVNRNTKGENLLLEDTEFWSSTRNPYFPKDAWVSELMYGKLNSASQTLKYNICCVRGKRYEDLELVITPHAGTWEEAQEYVSRLKGVKAKDIIKLKPKGPHYQKVL